jgi:predicted kinase
MPAVSTATPPVIAVVAITVTSVMAARAYPADVQAVILCGLQGSGKTTLYRDRFLATHVRISLDLLRTRHREAEFLRLCLETRMPFAVDNTNATAAERARYVAPALAAGFAVVGYLVEVDFALAAGRNAGRAGRARVPEAGLRDAARRFVRPAPAEGFAELWHATAADGGWRIEPLLTTPPLF